MPNPVRARLLGNPTLLPWLVIVMHLALVAPVLFPSLSRIGSWDESVYMIYGKQLLAGEWPRYTAGPLVGAVYALACLTVQASDDWLVHTNWIGRVGFMVLLWIASLQVARQLRGRTHPLVLVVLVALSPVLTVLVSNGSMALFTGFSGLALAQALAFERSGRVAHLWRASLFVGLAALARSEGPVLFVILTVITLPVCMRERLVVRGLVACLVPFLVLNVGYVALRGFATGDYAPGTRERSYFTFEQGHGMAFAHAESGVNFYAEGEATAPLEFGTAKENDHSVLKAIRRNPDAYFKRIPRLSRMVLKDAFSGYGTYFGLFCAAFALRGFLELMRTRAFHFAAILVAWAGYAVLYPLLCYQPAHLLMPYFTLFALSAIGVTAFARNLGSVRERWCWTGTLLAVMLAAVVFMEPISTLGRASLVFLLAMWIVWTVYEWQSHGLHLEVIACLTLLAAAMTLKTHPMLRTPLREEDPEKPAAAYMASHFKPGARIAAWAVKTVWAASLNPVIMEPEQYSLKTSEDIAAWLQENKVEGIYLDPEFRRYEASTAALIQELSGKGFEIGFDGGDTGIQVLTRSAAE
jgi:hypothetical protein